MGRWSWGLARSTTVAGALLAVFAASAPPAAAAAGDVNSSFGQSGLAAVPFPNGGATTAMAVQSDGKIVVVGDADTATTSSGTTINLGTPEIGVARLMPDGSADSSFGTSGVTTTKLADDDHAARVAVAPDGGILVLADTATAPASSTSPPSGSVVLLRYTSAGKPDSTFGTSGSVTLAQGELVEGSGLAVLASGQILVGLVTISGSSSSSPLTASGSVMRLQSGGQTDTTFGAAGSVSVQGVPTNLALDQSGNVVVPELTLGSTPSQDTGLVQRLSSAGVPDPTFGQAGTASLPVAPTPLAPVGVAPGAGGTLYVTVADLAGETGVLRLTSSGAVDTTFGRGGQISVASPLNDVSVGSDPLSSSDLPLILHGVDTNSLLAWGFNADGTPALGFGNQGVALSAVKAADAGIGEGGGAVRSDGSILAGATYISSSTTDSSGGLQLNPVVTEFSGGAVSGGTQTNLVNRIAGSDRLATAIATSQSLFPAAPQSGANGPINAAGRPYAQAVVLASADTYPDALVGVPLAVANGGPLLLTHQASLDERVSGEIDRVLGGGSSGATVFVVGGAAAVSDQIVGQITSAGYHVERLAGANRYDTAVQVAGALGDPPVVMEATGTDFADATSAGAAAAYEGGAILLTAGSTMPQETKAYISANPSDVRIAVGGPASQADPQAQSVAGADRYATSAALASLCFPTPGTVGLATGLQYPDALAGGVAAALQGGPLLLTDPNSLPAPAATYLKGVAPWTATADAFGGVGAVSQAVVAAVQQDIT
ncbi:MAG TPA: cell wall-binding repeat-containing protein [Acidimicrobiales bacterium]|nr:cell wall-binding repeat-containing protein [Acidimicrobiales bacterium]